MTSVEYIKHIDQRFSHPHHIHKLQAQIFLNILEWEIGFQL